MMLLGFRLRGAVGLALLLRLGAVPPISGSQIGASVPEGWGK